MDRATQIEDWYHQLERVSQDDQADFEVMLLDHHDPADASAAIMGTAMNLMEKGIRNDLMQLLFKATHSANERSVQLQAITHIISLYWMQDDIVRSNRDLQEWLLDMLADHPGEIPQYVHALWQAHKKLNHLQHVKDLKQTLLYEVAIVGERERKEFE